MEKQKKFKAWFKKFGTYTIAGGLVFTMAITILITGATSTTTANTSDAKNPVISVGTQPLAALTFTLPMTDASIIKNFSTSELYYNNTLDRWEFHDGIDFVSNDLKVYAIANGTVKNVYSDYAKGTVVEIDHGNNLVSVYSSLNEDVLVEVGDKIEKNEQIGTADDSAAEESEDGAHLHLSILENDEKIDPANYLDLENK